LGVKSFKIEGRLKSPEYVAAVTRVYRKAIDAALAAMPPPTAPSDRASNYRQRDFVADREPGTASPMPDEPPPVERPTVAVLGTRDDDARSWLLAGQALGRLLLTASSLGVSASPMTQPLEVPDTRARLSAELGIFGHPQMLLRLGYSNDEAGGDAPETPRRPVEDILTQVDE